MRRPEGEQIKTKIANLRADEYMTRTLNQDLNQLELSKKHSMVEAMTMISLV